jgi:hypothetical protein
MISEIAKLNTVETTDNSSPETDINDSGKPLIKNVGGFNCIRHDRNVARNGRIVKDQVRYIFSCISKCLKRYELTIHETDGNFFYNLV